MTSERTGEVVREAMQKALGSTHPDDGEVADAIVAALLALPVKQRMEAMGMSEVNIGGQADAWAVDLSEPVPNDQATYWTEAW